MPSTRREAYFLSPLSPTPGDSGCMRAPTCESTPEGMSMKTTLAAKASKRGAAFTSPGDTLSTARASAVTKAAR